MESYINQIADWAPFLITLVFSFVVAGAQPDPPSSRQTKTENPSVPTSSEAQESADMFENPSVDTLLLFLLLTELNLGSSVDPTETIESPSAPSSPKAQATLNGLNEFHSPPTVDTPLYAPRLAEESSGGSSDGESFVEADREPLTPAHGTPAPFVRERSMGLIMTDKGRRSTRVLEKEVKNELNKQLNK